uniref:Uncharacterized protein n=1 Tax=viral metagenome TaxID=1070528 RepID=A0A6M3JTY7_9ZZZZ
MFCAEALNGINEKYEAILLSKEEAKRRIKDAHKYDQERFQDALDRDEPLLEVNGELLTENEMYEQYCTCEQCGKLVDSQPLTWGVLQYKTTEDGEIMCNQCYAAWVVKQVANREKVHGWPVQRELEFEQFRHVLEHRALEAELRNAGWEVVYEGGGDMYSPQSNEYAGQSLFGTHKAMQDIVEAEGHRVFVVTAVFWQFAADLYLWRHR